MSTFRVMIGLLLLGMISWTASKAQSHTPGPDSHSNVNSVPEKQHAPEFQERAPRYQIGANDVLEVNFEFSPEFNQTVTVQPDGYITMKAVGDVYAATQTVAELKARIVQAYSGILKDPVITVTLKEFEKPYFIVSGRVGHPGKFDLRGEITLTQAIAIAGGFDDTSKDSRVVLYRQVSKQWMEGRIFDVKKMHKEANLSEDVVINPGDMIFVPQNTFSKIRRFIPMPGLGMSVSPM